MSYAQSGTIAQLMQASTPGDPGSGLTAFNPTANDTSTIAVFVPHPTTARDFSQVWAGVDAITTAVPVVTEFDSTGDDYSSMASLADGSRETAVHMSFPNVADEETDSGFLEKYGRLFEATLTVDNGVTTPVYLNGVFDFDDAPGLPYQIRGGMKVQPIALLASDYDGTLTYTISSVTYVVVAVFEDVTAA